MEVVIAVNLNRVSQQLEDDAFFLCVVNFFLTCRKLCLGTAVYNVYFLSTHTLCAASSVHCYVAAAEYSDALCVVNRRVRIFLVCLHQVYTGQVLIRRVNAVEALTRNAHEVRQTGARAYENSLVTSSKQVVDGLGTADNKVEHELYALCLQRVDFLLYDCLRQTELRNAVHQHAAGGVQYFKYGNLVALCNQIACTGQTSRACTDNSNLVTVGCRYFDRIVGRMCHCIVSSKALQTANANRFALDAADTLALALALLRAYTTTDSRKGAGLLDLCVCFQELAFLNQGDELRNLYIYRTAANTRLIFTVQAAGCFVHCGSLVITEGNFQEVLISYVRILFRDRILHWGHIRLCHLYFTSIFMRLHWCSLAACSCGL